MKAQENLSKDPKEMQIKDMLCDGMIKYLESGGNNWNPGAVKVLAETYGILFGQYQLSNAASTSPSNQSSEMTNEEKVAKINRPSERVKERQESTEGGPEIIG